MKIGIAAEKDSNPRKGKPRSGARLKNHRAVISSKLNSKRLKENLKELQKPG
jgi:hypothetical protein